MKRFSRLSESDFEAIRQEFSSAGVKRGEDLEDAVTAIDWACCHAVNMEDYGDPTRLRNEIRAVADSVAKTLDAMSCLSLRSRLAIADAGSDELLETNQQIREYFGSGITGEGLSTLREKLEALSELSGYALNEIEVRRGPPINKIGRCLAFEIRSAISDLGLNPTSYDDGIYMKVLCVAMEALLPDSGPEAHQRHGIWALSVVDEDDIDWATMRRPKITS